MYGSGVVTGEGKAVSKLTAASFAFCLACRLAAGAVWYVDANSPAPPEQQDGLSWETAYATIQPALDAAEHSVAEIWVAAGAYTGTGDYVIEMNEGVDVYGGFLGNAPGGFETARSQRDWANLVTAIDGEAARCCVRGANDATLDGLALRNGRGIYIPMTPLQHGGGLFNENVSPTVRNCLFVNCSAKSAAAMWNDDASPTVQNCVFLANHVMSGGAVFNGGASSPLFDACLFAFNVSDYQHNTMFNGSSGNVEIRNCMFVENRCTNASGTVANQGPVPALLANCLFVQNWGGQAGALENRASAPLIVNCTFHRNQGPQGGGAVMSYDNATPSLVNCILWDNGATEIYDEAGSATAVTYSDVKGGWPGTGNIAADPQFVTTVPGACTSLVYDSVACKTTVAQQASVFIPNEYRGYVLWITYGSEETAYIIADNSAESFRVWGDVTRGGSVSAPLVYNLCGYRPGPTSPCLDSGRDVSARAFGSVVDDMVGNGRGQDLGDGPTGPPPPGDGSDYDMGAYESGPGFPYGDVNRSGEVDAVDIQIVINAALDFAVGFDCDLNGNGSVNAVDVQEVINAALGFL